MRPCRLLLAVLAAAAVSPVSPVATTKRRFGDDDSDSAVISSAAADSGARHTPKDWGINGGQIYFDEISGQFKARPPGGSSVSRKSNEDEGRKDDLMSSKTGGDGREGLDIVSSVRTRGQSTEEDAGRLSNKVLKRRKKWRKTTLTAASSAGDAEENEVGGGGSRDPEEGEGEEESAGSEATRARDNAADDILAKARWGR
jgi:hypothetical protein